MRRISFALFFSLILVSPIFSQAVKTQQAEPVDPLTENISKLKSKDAMVRRQAAESLGALRDAKAIVPLISALKDENPFVKRAAVDSLGLLRAGGAIKNIGDILLKDKDSQTRQSAAISLGYIGNPEASQFLISALKDSDQGVKYAAAASLGQMRSPEAVKAISAALSDDDSGMKVSALTALDRMDAASEVESVRKLISDNDPKVRSLAVKFLGKYKDSSSAQSILPLLKDSDKMVVINSAYALGRLGDTSGLQPTAKILKTEKETSIKMAAIESLEAINNKESVNMLKGLLNDDDQYVKDAAKYALIRLRVPLDEPPKKPAAKEPVKKK